MAELKEAPTGAQSLQESDVVAYLDAHPDLLTRYPELLERMELQHASGSAISLIERQVEVLRGRSQRLEDRLTHLLDAARDNETRAAKIHKLARALIRAPTLAAAMLVLRTCLAEDFGIDDVFVGVFGSILRRTDIDGLVRIEPDGPVARAYDNLLRTKLVECGPIAPARAQLLFPRAATPPLSAAVMPLERDKALGLLALGSPDALRFQPRQGKRFLDMSSELVAAAIRAKLA